MVGFDICEFTGIFSRDGYGYAQSIRLQEYHLEIWTS
jgi:hypothetical protein